MAVSAALDARRLLEALAASSVRYVLTGSIAAAAWAGETSDPPGDLDIVPEISADNLNSLGALLTRCGARPVHRPDWKRTLSPEECARWKPEPATAEQLDHQLETPWGLLDVVPLVSGEYVALARRAVPFTAWGVEIFVADPEDLIATIRTDTQEKRRRREPVLAAQLACARAGGRPRGLEFLSSANV